MSKKQSGFSAVEGLLILIILGLVSFTGWYVWHSKQSTDKTYTNAAKSALLTSTSAPVKADPYKGWKTYQNADKSLTIKYPGDWFIREDPTSSRVYVSTSSTVVTKENMPSGFQQVWISTDSKESSIENEDSVKNGNPNGRSVNGEITTSAVKSGDLTINTYEYNTVGGKTLQAFWSSGSGKRYYATNSTEVGQTNQQYMVDNLKKILASVVVK